MLSQGTTADNN